LLSVVGRSVPVEVEAAEDYPTRMELIELESLLVDEPIERYRAMLLLSRVVSRDLFAVVMFLCTTFIFNLACAFGLREQSSFGLDRVKELNDLVQVLPIA